MIDTISRCDYCRERFRGKGLLCSDCFRADEHLRWADSTRGIYSQVGWNAQGLAAELRRLREKLKKEINQISGL